MYSFVFVGKPSPSNNLRTDRFSTNKTQFFCARTNFNLNRGGILFTSVSGKRIQMVLLTEPKTPFSGNLSFVCSEKLRSSRTDDF